MLKLTIDGGEIRNKEELYNAIAKQLPLPDWFGRNLDALHDTLTCDILPAEEVSAELVNMEKLRENLGGYADALVNMMNDIAGEDKRLTVIEK